MYISFYKKINNYFLSDWLKKSLWYYITILTCLFWNSASSQNIVKVNCFYPEFVPEHSNEDSILMTVKEPFKKDRYYKEFNNKYFVSFNINVSEPCPAILCIGNDCLDVFFDSQEIFINMNKENIELSTITGSSISNEWITISDSLRNYKSQLLDIFADQIPDGKKIDMSRLFKMHNDMDSSYINFVQKIIEKNNNILGWTIAIRNIENFNSEYLNIMLVRFKQFSELESYRKAKLIVDKK